MKDRFLEFVADVMDVDVSDLSMKTTYKEFGAWDSLMMLNIIMEMEDEYGVTIPMEKVGEIKTLQDLFDYIKD